MTERAKAVARIARSITETPTTSALVDQVDDLFENAVRHIDWTRVLLHAAGRHAALGHVADVFTGIAGACGPCVREALLMTDTVPVWTAGEPIDPQKAPTP